MSAQFDNFKALQLHFYLFIILKIILMKVPFNFPFSSIELFAKSFNFLTLSYLVILMHIYLC